MIRDHGKSGFSEKLSKKLDVDFALEATGLGVWELDNTVGAISWDDRCSQLFGLASDNYLTYEKAIRHIHPEDVERVNQAVLLATNPESDGYFDQTYRTLGADDGKLRWVRFYGRAYFSENCELIRFAGVAHEVTEQKMIQEREVIAHQQILHQQGILEAISSSSPDLMYVFDLNYCFTYANKALLDMWGTDFESSVGKRLLDLGYEPWHAQMHEREIDQVVASRKPIRGEVSFPHATLGKRIYDYVFAPVFNESGKVEAIAGTTRDITDIRLAQHLSKQVEERFRKLVQTNINPIFVLRGEQMLLEIANQPVLDAWQIDQHAFGKPVTEILPDISQISEFLYSVYYHGETRYLAETPILYKRKDGDQVSYYNLLIQPFIEGDDQITGVTVMATDITEQIIARRALEEKETALINAIELAELGTWSIDLKNRNFTLSARVTEWFGFDTHTVSIEQFLTQISSEDRVQVKDRLLASMKPLSSGNFDQIFSIINSRNGQRRVIHAVGRAYSGNLKSEIRIDGSAHDITAVRELTIVLENQVEQRTEQLAAINWKLENSNKELQQSNHSLTASNENLQNFTYIASHDLQEPLRKIQQFADLLSNQSETLSPAGLDYITRMRSAAQRMSVLIRDISDFSQVSNQLASSETVSLTEIITHVLNVLEINIAENNAVIQFDNLPQILGDASQLSQLFQNLIGNAIKFHRPSSPPFIQITCNTLTATELPSFVKPEVFCEYYYQINVEDNGIGFDENNLDRIFQVFQRLHGKAEFPGTGIGLAICKRVVTNHGGAITASSQSGQGSVFKIFLPLRFGDISS